MTRQESSPVAAPSAPISLSEAAQMRFLDPRKLKFFKAGAVLRLTIDGEQSFLKTSVFRVFPLSHPNQYFSIQDNDGKEAGILKSLDNLDADSRRLIEQELHRRYFVPVIHRIRSVIERFGTVEWNVDTDRGPWRFTTRDLRDNALRLGGGRYILPDVDENRYEIPDSSRLDFKSLAYLLRHL